MPDTPSAPSLRIGEFVLNPSSHELDRGGERRRLPRLQALLLARLAQAPGQVVDRDTLIADVWRRSHVDPDVLSRNVAELRRALGDDAREPRYIETIPKGGYRLLASVSALATGRLADAPRPGGASADRRALPAAITALLIAAVLVAVVWFAIAVLVPSAVPDRAAVRLDRERPLTSDPGIEISPALSADGALVAFVSIPGGSTGTDLVVMAADGSARRILDEPAGGNVRPRFSPDGTRLAFVRHESGRCEVRVRPLMTGVSRRVAHCASSVASSIDWSPDGSTIAFTAPAADGRAHGIAIVTVAEGTIRALTSPEIKDGDDLDPRFAPDGRRVAFTRGQGALDHVRAVTVGPTAVESELFPGFNRISGHAWTPDGRHLVIGTDWPGYRALVEVDIASGHRRVLGARGGQFPTLSRGGDLAYELATYDANIWRADLEPGAPAPHPVIRSTRYDGTPVWSPAGDRFVFGSTREDQESLWMANADGSNEYRVPLDPSLRWTHPSWSPDARVLLVSTYEDDVTWVYRHELDSGRSTRLETLGAGAYGAAYTRDGASIVFARRDAAASQSIWQIGADLAGEPRRLVGNVDRFAVGDGVIAYREIEKRGLHVLDLASGENHELDAPIDDDNSWDWTLVGRTLWYAAIDPDGTPPALFRRELDSASAERITEAVVPTAAVPSLAVSPDQRSVLFVRTDEFRSDLMYVPGAWSPTAR